MSDASATYLSYLLRLWREEQNDKYVWRASLESAQTRAQHNFATLDELIAFLRGLLAEPAGPDERHD
jgi:hypothetical protein